MDWDSALAAISKIPATFWGVVAGSFFTSLGVWLTNRSAIRRHREQLKHDTKQRRVDREQALRKEIYLAATEATSAGMISVTRFADLDLPNASITTPFTERAPSIAKVHVIATVPTAQAVERLTRELGAAYSRLIVQRVPLVFAKSQLTAIEHTVEEINKESARWVEMMKQENLAGRDEHRWAWIQRNYEFEQKRLKETMEERDRLRPELTQTHLNFLEICTRESFNLQEFTLPALIAIRQELGFAADESEIRRIFEQGRVAQAEILRAMVNEIRELTAPAPMQPTAPP